MASASHHLGSHCSAPIRKPSAPSSGNLSPISHLHPRSPSSSTSDSPLSANQQSSKGSRISSASPKSRDRIVDHVLKSSNPIDKDSAIHHDCTEKYNGWISVQKFLKSAQFSADKEFDSLLGRFSEDITLLRTNEESKFENVVYSLAEELEKERRLRKMLDKENKKLHMYAVEAERALAKAEKAAIKAEKKLEKEKLSRMQMDVLYAGLARGLYQHEAEGKKLKIEQVKEREAIEEEQKGIRKRETWCGEKVHMKLSDAKMELEQRCIAFDDLKLKLDMFLNLVKAPQFDTSLELQGKSLKATAEKLQIEMARSMHLLEGLNGNVSSNTHHDGERDLAKDTDQGDLFPSQGSHISVDLCADGQGEGIFANEEIGEEHNDGQRLSNSIPRNVSNVEGQEQEENAQKTLSDFSQRMYELSKRLEESENGASKLEWSLPEHERRKFRRSYFRDGMPDHFCSQGQSVIEINSALASYSELDKDGCDVRKASRRNSSNWSKEIRRINLQAIEDEMNELDLNLEHLTRERSKK